MSYFSKIGDNTKNNFKMGSFLKAKKNLNHPLFFFIYIFVTIIVSKMLAFLPIPSLIPLHLNVNKPCNSNEKKFSISQESVIVTV